MKQTYRKSLLKSLKKCVEMCFWIVDLFQSCRHSNICLLALKSTAEADRNKRWDKFKLWPDGARWKMSCYNSSWGVHESSYQMSWHSIRYRPNRTTQQIYFEGICVGVIVPSTIHDFSISLSVPVKIYCHSISSFTSSVYMTLLVGKLFLCPSWHRPKYHKEDAPGHSRIFRTFVTSK